MMMNAMGLNELLTRLNACGEGVEYAQGKTFGEAWDACERPDWMLWLAGRVGADRKRLVMAACACARTALRYVADGDARPRIAIETAEGWCRGDVGIEEVRAAAAEAVDAATAAAFAAGAAAHAAYADDAADAAAFAADAVAYAAIYATAYTIAYAAHVAAHAAAHATMAPLVREHLDADYMQGLLKAL